jgi:hypothetical protein
MFDSNGMPDVSGSHLALRSSLIRSNVVSDDDRDDAGPPGARGEVTAGPGRDTESGAPTDEAHREVGDGTLVGSIPAGLSPEELCEIANSDQSVESGTG